MREKRQSHKLGRDLAGRIVLSDLKDHDAMDLKRCEIY